MNQPYVFISYDRRDHLIAMEISEFFRDCNCVPFLDTKDNLPGDRWRKKMYERMEQSDIVVLLITNHSLTSINTVNEEFQLALKMAADEKITLIPLLLEPLHLPPELKSYQFMFWNTTGKVQLRQTITKVKDEISFALFALGGLSFATVSSILWLSKHKLQAILKKKKR